MIASHGFRMRVPNQFGDDSGVNPLSSSRTKPCQEMGGTNRHRRFPNRRLLARQQIQTDKPRHVGALAIPGAAGELIDKITILEIKESYIKEAAKLDNIRLELHAVAAT